jgi:hypothetical protein
MQVQSELYSQCRYRTPCVCIVKCWQRKYVCICSDCDPPPCITQYRPQPDASVTIVSIGFFTNLAALINSSTADACSPLSGPQLIQQKVGLDERGSTQFRLNLSKCIIGEAPCRHGGLLSAQCVVAILELWSQQHRSQHTAGLEQLASLCSNHLLRGYSWD